MGIRKNILYMTSVERDLFFEALLKMKATIVNPVAPTADQYSVYDQFASLHWAVFNVSLNQNGPFLNAGHQGPAFLSWHRELLRRFEIALQAEVPGVMLPYWDWSPAVFTETLMGPNGGVNGVGGGLVRTGWFAFDRPGTGVNTTPLPAWWPPTLEGWRIRPDLDDTNQGTALRRFFGQSNGDTLPTQSDVVALLAITAANPANAAQRQTAAANFRTALEQGSIGLGVTSSHNEVHRYIGGHMGAAMSTNDPIFWLHHCNIDRLWAMWQLDGHTGPDWYPVSTVQGHALAHSMWPWVGNVPYFIGNQTPTFYFPNFGNVIRTNADLLDHHLQGYACDTEPVLGIALDRSGSMVGASTDPFNMGAPTTKWELAKLGVENLMSDCEAAYAAGEAYVIGGVQTFTTSGGSNDISPVVAGKPYGLIRAGANYPEAYPAADVNTGLAATAPSSATPLAAALFETYADVVRPPSNALPPDDTRYLAILTDGKETAAPLLNTLAANQFFDTYIFGMGFGSGTGWDGVDYATIDTIVSKGKTPPPTLGLTQVFQGETMGAIDKFYSNTIARVIGYTPIMDPRFELFPGEEVHLPFWTTSADDGVFITVLRGNDDLHCWHLALMSPDGGRYHESSVSPYFITIQRRGRRDTIFLRRNLAADSRWLGRWFLHLAYCPPGHVHPDDHEHEGGAGHAEDHRETMFGGMIMPTTWDLIVPASAPPLAGPVFAQYNVPKAKRVSTRVLASRTLPTVGGPAVAKPFPPAMPVVVNFYAKTTLHVGLQFDGSPRFAGDALSLKLRVKDEDGGQIQDMRAYGRVIAPGSPIGAAFRDQKTISLALRKKYVLRTGEGVLFDELRFLADYERAKPGVFAPRDERLVMRGKGEDLSFESHIEKTEVSGAYRVGAYFEGFLIRPGRPPEYFVRTVSAETSLSVRLDHVRSKPNLRWLGARQFQVTFTPMDRFGNLLSPTSVAMPTLRLKGRELRAAHENLLDGSHRLVVTLLAGDARPKGQSAKLAAKAKFDGLGGAFEVERGEALRLSLDVAGQMLPVSV